MALESTKSTTPSRTLIAMMKQNIRVVLLTLKLPAVSERQITAIINISQILDVVDYDMKNFQAEVCRYQLRPKVGVDNKKLRVLVNQRQWIFLKEL